MKVSFIMENKRKIIYVIVPFLIALTIILFHQNNLSKNMDPEINKKIKAIGQKNIYFGHRSVGENIISGLNNIISENAQNELKIEELKNNSKFEGSYFVHSNIGHNGDPQSKFDEFTRIVNNLASMKLDIAMMKLCFVDITNNTNITDVFKSYVAMIDSIQNKYPGLTIIHFSVPLKSKPSLINNIKGLIKGPKNYDPQDNLARNKYNEFLYSKYSREDIFDLAEIESTYPHGKRESYIIDGKLCYFLIKDYTDDGGHLNDLGKQIVAEKLIIKLFERITLINAKLNQNSFLTKTKTISK
jgi:hypothetical protein